MNKQKTSRAIAELCMLMQELNAIEMCVEAGLNGGAVDGARYLIHIVKQCPITAVEDEDEEE
jgi:hypothetical protein